MFQRLLPVGYAWMVVQGLLAVFLPRRSLELSARFLLRGYENPGDLEPKDWYVRSTRITGLGMLVTGITGLLAGQVVATGTDDGDDSEAEPVELDV